MTHDFHETRFRGNAALTLVETGTALVDAPGGERFAGSVLDALDGAGLDPELEGTSFEVFYTSFQRLFDDEFFARIPPGPADEMNRFRDRLRGLSDARH